MRRLSSPVTIWRWATSNSYISATQPMCDTHGLGYFYAAAQVLAAAVTLCLLELEWPGHLLPRCGIGKTVRIPG